MWSVLKMSTSAYCVAIEAYMSLEGVDQTLGLTHYPSKSTHSHASP